MATLLSKDVTRESSEEVGGRNILVTLTEKQEVNLRLKGLRGDGESIDIADLYQMLSGGSESTSNSKSGGNIMISLNDLRSSNLISTLDYETKVKFESIILNLIDRR